MTLLDPTIYCVNSDPVFEDLKEHIIDVTGLAYYRDKDNELAARITRRLAVLQVPDCSAYMDLLSDGRAGEAELDAITAGLTIGETFFFRHEELFDALRDRVFPELIERNQQHRRLRIWSAGCAIGAEPYSLAILLRRNFAAQLAGWNVSILGTDINRDFLAQAQRGEFSDWSFRSAPENMKVSCFSRLGQNWVIKDEFRRGVLFHYHNLVQHPFPPLVDGLSRFDLILCRNVMIYFAPPIVGRLVGQFQDCLVDGGWFVVGPAEPSVELFRGFQTVNGPGVVLYRRGPRSAAPSAGALSDSALGVEPSSDKADAGPRLVATASKNELQISAKSSLRPTATGADTCRPLTAPSRASLADARARLNGGQSMAAVECCRKLMTTERLNPCVHFYHALASDQQGRHAEAEQALRRAIYLDREYVLAHYHLALVLQRRGDASAAKRSFRNALALLDRRAAAEAFPDADGLTVAALRQLTDMHLKALNRI